VVDVRYRDFVADPLPTIAAIYDRLGLALSAEAEGHMRAFLAAHPQGRHGGHRYTFDATGLDAVEWRARAEHYQAFFEVPSEPLG
jgi:hypothetical protein